MALITPQEIADIQRYDEDEINHIKMLIAGAEAFLKGADAFRKDNDLTKVVLSLIVGLWLENREGNISDYKEVGDFPLALQGLITQLKYSGGDETDD